MSLSSQVPDAGTPIFDASGYINPVWHQFFFNLLNRTGGTTGTSSGDSGAQIAALTKRTIDSEAEEYSLVSSNRILALAPDGPVYTHGNQTDPLLHAVATSSSEGFLSIPDKVKLDTVVVGAAVASVSGTAPISSTGGGNPIISISAATPLAPGSLSAADKAKLDTLSSVTAPAVELLADVVSSNSTADFSVLTWTLPANTASAGTTVALRLYGLVTTAAIAGTISIWIKKNGTKIFTQTFTLPVTGVNTAVFYTATGTIRTIGASGVMQLSSLMTSNNNALNGGPVVATISAATDTTVANTYIVGWNWSVANAGDVATAKNAAIYLEKQ